MSVIPEHAWGIHSPNSNSASMATKVPSTNPHTSCKAGILPLRLIPPISPTRTGKASSRRAQPARRSLLPQEKSGRPQTVIFLLCPPGRTPTHWWLQNPQGQPSPGSGSPRQGLSLGMVEASNPALNQARRDFKQVPAVLQPSRICKGVFGPV